MNIEISIIIPTKDRQKDLIECIESIKDQTFLPIEVIVIDDGEISEITKKLIRELLSKKGIFFEYFKKDKPGLAESKNLGAESANGNIVLFLDDDVILDKNYIKKLADIWKRNKKDKKLAGISGIAINTKVKFLPEKIFDRIFCLYSLKPWSILAWGFQTWDYNLEKEEKVQWTPCGFTSFRREILQKYQFKALQPGRTALEDIEFCCKLNKNGYYFIITPFAKLIHREVITGREKAFISGYKEGFNRCLIFQNYARKTFKNYLCFSIASVGWIIRQWLGALIEPKSGLNHLLLSFGLIKGNCCFLLRLFSRKK